MSYILEALRKAEQERNLGRVPDLQTSPMPMPETRRRLWPLVLGLILVVNGVLLAVLLWPKHWSHAPAEPVSTASQDATANRSADQLARIQTEPTFPPPIPAPTVQSAPEPISAAAINEIPVLPLPTSLPRAESLPPPDPAPAVTQSVLALQALPMEFRRSVPKLNLDIHVYSTTGRKRFVLINSKRYQEGDRLNEGPLLESITANGAVLSYRGQRFLLPVYQ